MYGRYSYKRRKKMAKRVLIGVAVVIGLVLLLLVGLIGFLTITEYKPETIEDASLSFIDGDSEAVEVDEEFTLCTWNIGYGGLGKESDFFMDGGKMVNPPSKEVVDKNLIGITSFIDEADADAWLIQEADLNSAHTDNVDEVALLQEHAGDNGAFAYNYNCKFVPIPWPPMGRVEAGVATYTDYNLIDVPQRIALPCPFKWPVSAANLKRCLLVSRVDLEGTDKELVLVNLHLEAYDDGEGKIAQTNQLISLLTEEYEKGNYVVAGGDFNQSFPGVLDKYPVTNPELWTPGVLENSILPEGWSFAYDMASPTCRLLDKPYDGTNQLYVIDGFIVSPNVNVNTVKTVDLGFEHSDHNPVELKFTFK